MNQIPLEWLLEPATSNDPDHVIEQVLRLAGCPEGEFVRMARKTDYDLEEEINQMIREQNDSGRLWCFASPPEVPGDEGGGFGLTLRRGEEMIRSIIVIANPHSVRHPLERTKSPGDPHPLLTNTEQGACTQL